MSISVGVYGAAGYTGQELILLLADHPQFVVEFAVSDSSAGETVFGTDLQYIPQAKADLNTVDLVFLCTPHGASAQLAAQALQSGAKVVDLSADLRLKSVDDYQQWYELDHPTPELLPTPYGLPEIHCQDLQQTDVIANPGCYPTASLVALAPLAHQNYIQPNAPVIIDAKSGVSGAGRNPKPHTHFVEVFGDLKPYSIGRAHRHTGEIEQQLKQLFPSAGTVIFTPHLLPVDRGILATVYVPLIDGITLADLQKTYEDFYANAPLVDVLPSGRLARLKDAVRTNKAVLSVSQPTPNMALIVSAIDNLRKGAASQAIQNANILFNLPDTTGLL